METGSLRVLATRLRVALAPAAAAAAQQHQVLSIADHFGEVFLLPFLVFVTACFETAFQVDLLTFQKEIGNVLGSPYDDIVPVGDVFPFAGLRSLLRRPVARENLETEIPLGVNLVSASLPRLPSRMTLLTLLDAILS